MYSKYCKTIYFAALAVFTLALSGNAIQAEEWGDLKGRFVYDGKAAAPVKLNINKDVDYCGKAPAPEDESLVVSDKGGLANVIIWVRTKDVKAHPDYAALLKEKAVIDNSHCRFDPHVVVCRVGQPLEIKNSDPNPVAHNTMAALANNNPFNFQLPAGSSQEMKPLTSPESLPAAIGCNIHGWMKGWLVVPPTPYVAVSDKDGKFEIKNVPAGSDLEFQVWHEKSGFVQKANLGGKDAGWTKGRFKKSLKAGENDLGDIKLDPSQFNK